MPAFFAAITTIKQELASVSFASSSITELKHGMLSAVTNKDEVEYSARLRKVVLETNATAKRAKSQLDAIKAKNDSLLAGDSYLSSSEDDESRSSTSLTSSASSQTRIRVNLTTTVTRKFVHIIQEYQKAQQDYHDEAKNKVTRQVQIAKPTATAEEITSAVLNADGGGAQQIFKEQILTGDVSHSIQNSSQRVSAKYNDVLMLEASVNELHQMFLDFSLLTELQGEMFDSIEYNVINANDFIEEANLDLVGAIEYQRKIRKKQCCVIVVVLLVMLGLGLGFGLA
jgi:t-SNARE complex subunit (syntaxin)